MRDATDESVARSVHGADVDARWTSRDLVVLAVVTAVAVAVRLVSIAQWSWSGAEVATLAAVTQPFDAGEHGFTANAVSGYPIAFLALRWLADAGMLGGYTEGWLRLPFAFVGALAVPLLALFARPRVGRGAASMAAVVLAVHPAHVEACQTASPIVMAITAAVAAAVITRERATPWSWLLVVFAGLLHPIGWLAALGAVIGASPGGFVERQAARLPRLVWVVAAAPALRVAPDVLETVRLPVVVLAAFAFCVRPRIARMLAWMTLPLLVFGGALTLLGAAGRGGAVAAVVPMATLAAAAGCTHAFALLRRSVPWQGRIVTLLGATPATVVVGEAVTALFLYFVVFAGGRAPWRELRGPAFAAMRSGGELRVATLSGREALLSYLRPSHWSDPAGDPHPGRVVEPLARGALGAQLEDPAILLALTVEEWNALRAEDADGLLRAFRVVRLVPCELADGDSSLYLLQRPQAD